MRTFFILLTVCLVTATSILAHPAKKLAGWPKFVPVYGVSNSPTGLMDKDDVALNMTNIQQATDAGRYPILFKVHYASDGGYSDATFLMTQANAKATFQSFAGAWVDN